MFCSLGAYTKSGIIGSSGRSIFSNLRNFHRPIYIPTNSVWEFLVPHTLQNWLFLVFLIKAIIIVSHCLTVDLICIHLMLGNDEHFFSHAHWLSVHILWRTIYTTLLLFFFFFFDRVAHFFVHFMSFSSILYISSLFDILCLIIFSHSVISF